MEYFAGLDVSMEETHVSVVDRDGKVILEARTPTAPKTIAAALAKGPAVERALFETGRMAPMLFHGLTALGLPVVCVESRQAYQALRSLAAHKTDRNDARGLAHLARSWSASAPPSKIRSADWRWRSASGCRAGSVPALPKRRWLPVAGFPASMARCGDCSPHAMLS